MNLKRMNQPAPQLLFGMTILGAAKTGVCSLVHNFAVCLRGIVSGVAGERISRINLPVLYWTSFLEA
jgi:hypothetical protein